MKARSPAISSIDPSNGAAIRCASRFGRAFSLVELLVVVAVMLILMSLLIPTMSGIAVGTNIARVGDQVAAGLSLARQRASTFNRQVAMRFYYDDTLEGFASFQIFEKPESTSDPEEPSSWVSVATEERLPLGVKILQSPTHSPLLEKFSGQKETKPRGEVTYSEVLLTPAGSLVASTPEAVLTVVPTQSRSSGGVVEGLPPNFATIVVEPFNVRPTIYRP